MTYGWGVNVGTGNSIIAKVLGPGSVIEGEEDEDGDTEDWTVPDGQVALMFQQRYLHRNHLGNEVVSVYDMFFIHGTPKEIWNALGAGMAALPEG